ncbi:hypothetical protein [Corynebacterium wankanglinii]|uniref:Uncharacterized protein n=1 Tax=Corynebacterium wankanglinii TaxID=2735136 RepID=A0A838CKB5_9CORY|nr:hypothetical protein [Corynebacterium wankanglinii]MBA1835651.1 hypothetical protein [Corynebacterium wankanglinii]
MRIPAAIAAASLTLAPATPVEQLLDSVSETHTTSITAINSAETDDEVRDVLIQWRKELITAADELADLREEAAADGLSKQEKATFDEADAAIKRERAGVRELRAELLPEDAPVVVPAPIEGLGGILGTTAFDAYERSDNGDAPIVFGIPGVDGVRVPGAEATTGATTTPATTRAAKPTVVKEPTAPTTTAPGFGPEVTHRVERLQDETTTETPSSTTSTETSTSTTSSATATESATSTTTAATTTTPATTTSASTTASVMENRTTSATSSTTRSSSTTTSSSSTTRSTTSSTATTEDDDERDGDLAETGTPMRALITVGVLSLLVGAALVLTGAARPRGARK